MEWCSPCQFRATSTTATKYCVTCQEAQCKTCYEVHKSSKATRAHLLINVEDFDKKSKIDQDLETFQRCLTHGKELLFFCTGHHHLICSSCLLGLGESGCKSLVDLKIAGESLAQSHFDDQVKSDLDSIVHQCLRDERETQNLLQSSQKEQENFQTFFRDLKTKLIDLLDRYEEQIQGEIDKNFKKEIEELNKHLESIENILKSAKHNKSKLDTVTKEGSKSDFFRCILSIINQFDSLKSACQVKEATVYKHTLTLSSNVCFILKGIYPAVLFNTTRSVKKAPEYVCVKSNKDSLTKLIREFAHATRSNLPEDYNISSKEAENEIDGEEHEKDETSLKMVPNEVHREVNGNAEIIMQVSQSVTELKIKHVLNTVTLRPDELDNKAAAEISTRFNPSQTDLKIKHISNIIIPMHDDKQSSLEGVTTLSDGRLVISDKTRLRLITLNENFSFSDELALTEEPGQITSVTADTIAVCLPTSNRIVTISLKAKMKWQGQFKTKHSPRGLYAIDKNRLFVSMVDDKMAWYLNVFTPTGTFIITVKQASAVLDASYISSIKLEKRLRYYLYCCKTSGSLYCLQADGTEIFQYKLKSPSGLCVDNTKYIYVVDSTGTLHVLTTDGHVHLIASIPEFSSGVTFHTKMHRLVFPNQNQSQISVYDIAN